MSKPLAFPIPIHSRSARLIWLRARWNVVLVLMRNANAYPQHPGAALAARRVLDEYFEQLEQLVVP